MKMVIDNDRLMDVLRESNSKGIFRRRAGNRAIGTQVRNPELLDTNKVLTSVKKDLDLSIFEDAKVDFNVQKG